MLFANYTLLYITQHLFFIHYRIVIVKIMVMFTLYMNNIYKL
jgi:hypothetical protein